MAKKLDKDFTGQEKEALCRLFQVRKFEEQDFGDF